MRSYEIRDRSNLLKLASPIRQEEFSFAVRRVWTDAEASRFSGVAQELHVAVWLRPGGLQWIKRFTDIKCSRGKVTLKDETIAVSVVERVNLGGTHALRGATTYPYIDLTERVYDVRASGE